jgi:hypothetical protein
MGLTFVLLLFRHWNSDPRNLPHAAQRISGTGRFDRFTNSVSRRTEITMDIASLAWHTNTLNCSSQNDLQNIFVAEIESAELRRHLKP